MTVPFPPTVQESSLLSTPCPVFIWLVWGDIYIYIKIYLFLTVLSLCCCFRASSSFSYWGLLSSCGVQASCDGGFSYWGPWALGHVGLVALWNVESSWTRDGTCVPCIGRQILNHWTTREVQLPVFYYTHFNNEKIEPHDTNLCMITLLLSGRKGMWWAVSQATVTNCQRLDDLDHIYFPQFWRLKVHDFIPGWQMSVFPASSGGGESGQCSCVRGH